VVSEPSDGYGSEADLEEHILELEKEMHHAAAELAFEQASEIRDRIKKLKQKIMYEG